MGVELSRVERYSGWAYTTEASSSTAVKLRSAWMPPAVAQAPIETRNREDCRTSWMRSASWGVVTDPSTRETS